MESRHLLTTFTVTTTADSGPGSIRQAILSSDLPHAGADNIDFAIPASTAPNLDAPVSGFDPTTQTWKISLDSPLPAITHQVTIDGFTEAQPAVPYRYPSETASQVLSITGSPTGGTFTLTTASPLPVGTVRLPFNANTAQVQAALASIVGAGNVTVFGGPALPSSTVTISFVGAYDGVAVSPLTGTSTLTGGTTPAAFITQTVPTQPTEITSTASTVAALDGNNATPRVILDGSNTGGSTGFVLDSPDVILRGMIIDGFGVGVSVQPGSIGDLIQGNDIGKYLLFNVDPVTGIALTGPDAISVGGTGNSLQGVLLGSTNTTVGGVETQDGNIISGNGLQGVSILQGAQGNQVFGNEIGILGPVETTGFYFIRGNGAEGVLIADSSNYVGSPASGAGNLISGNLGDGVRIIGPAATRNDVMGNYIGVGPGGGFLLGSNDPGNVGDGVEIENASDNNIGGSTTADRNVISSNQGAGVRILGDSGVRNSVQGNYIGLTADGISALGNGQAGVAIYSADNVVGPTNVISANLQGILFSGPGATGNLAQGNFIGTDATGIAHLGNAQEGIRIDSASDNTITGNAKGSQVISGNNVGLLIIGNMATGNLVLGNFIGTDVTGTLDLGNSQQGVEIENSPGNTIGSSATTGLNVISANYTGLEITGAQAVANVVQGNFIGTDVTGKLSVGDELDGVYINQGASGNLIGGLTGNTIAFNRRDGVRIEDQSVTNSVQTNSIFANLGLGIDLVPTTPPGPNTLPNAPTLTGVATSVSSSIITGTLTSTPNTTFTIQFFASSPQDPTGVGEGGQFLGQTTVVTGSNGVAPSYSVNVPTLLKSGQFVTATATDSSGNTSEFSSPISEVFGTVQFSMAGYTVNEGVGTATIVATRVGGSGGLFTINYATSDGSATAGTNYTAATGTLTFPSNVDTETFTVTIIDNGLAAPDTTVNLNLSNPTGPITIGSQSSAILTILGNQPGAVQFQMSDYFVDEAAGTATVTVTRSEGGPAATVDYSTTSGTAVAGTDYLPVAGTLTFSPGQLVQTFTVPILINPVIKSNETVLLNLSNPTGLAVLGNPSSAVLVIIDDGVDRMGPHVTSVRAVSGPVGVAEVVVSFDEALNPATATNLLNYGYSVRAAGRDGKLGTKDDRLIGLNGAIYNPTNFTVTLPLSFAVPNNTKLELMLNEATDVAGAGVGISDILGNLLDGNDDGHPGGSFTAAVTAEPAPKPVHEASSKASKPKVKVAVKHPTPVIKAKSESTGRSKRKA